MDNNFFWDTDPGQENQPAPAAEAPAGQPGAEPAPEERPEAEPQREEPVREEAKTEPVWHNETREGPMPPPPAPEKKKKSGMSALLVLIAVAAALVVGLVAVFAMDYAYIGIKDGALQIVVGPEASERANMQSGATDREPGGEVDPFLGLNPAPETEIKPPVEGEELTIGQIAEYCSPSVVGIVTQVMSNFTEAGEGSGSGIIMSADGYIVTNAHVVENARSISVLLADGTTHEASVVGRDTDSDIAVIKIDAKDLPVATFADSSTVRVGDPVVAIGNPYGMELFGTVTNGIISAVNREITVDEQTFILLQTNADINHGNSGGPLFNMYGQVIGINSLKLSDAYADGLGFAIPTAVFKPIVDELIQYGYIAGKPGIGVEGQLLTDIYTDYYGIPAGFMISAFRAMEPMQAGLRKGDIITEFAGESFSTMAELNKLKDKYKAGDEVELTVYRDDNFYDSKRGEYLKIKITLCDEQKIENNAN